MQHSVLLAGGFGLVWCEVRPVPEADCYRITLRCPDGEEVAKTTRALWTTFETNQAGEYRATVYALDAKGAVISTVQTNMVEMARLEIADLRNA